MTILKNTIILRQNWRNIWNKDRRCKNKKQMLVVRGRWKIIEVYLKIRKLIVNNQEITDQNKIQNEFLFFYESLFRNTSANTSDDCERFLNEVSVTKLNYEDARICEGDLNEFELLKALKLMQNNKSQGNDGLKKKFYETFWNKKKKKKILSWIPFWK